RAVCRADQGAAVLREELVRPEVEGRPDVGAPVDVRVVAAVEVDDEAAHAAPAALETERRRAAWRQARRRAAPLPGSRHGSHVTIGVCARDRRPGRDEDLQVGLAQPDPHGRAARRVAHRRARRHRRAARPERGGEDDAPVHPGDPADAGFGDRARAGPRRGPRRGPPAPAAQHGERSAVVPVEPARRRDRRVLRAPLRAQRSDAPAARRRADRALRALRPPADALQRAVDGAQAARRARQVARERPRAALPRRAHARPRPRRVRAGAPPHRRPPVPARDHDRPHDALHAGGRRAVRRDRVHQGRPDLGAGHAGGAQARDPPGRRDRLPARPAHRTPAEASLVLIGTVALSIVNVCQLEVAYAVLLDVWSKSLKHQFLAPIGIRHLTFGSWLVGMARGGVLFLLLAALGWWAFDFRVLAPGWLAVAVFLLGCFLNAWIVGVFVCALITLFGNRAEERDQRADEDADDP